MKKSRLLNVVSACLLIITISTPTSASSIILDWSPATTGGTVTSNNWQNVISGQHFGEFVSFTENMIIDGIDIYSGSPVETETQVLITIREDFSGTPGSELAQFSSSISEIDADGTSSGNSRFHADFSGFTMLAGIDYWIGMAGDNLDITQTALLGISGGDGRMAQFVAGGAFSRMVGIGDMAFRLYGSASAVPIPSAVWLFGSGLLGLVGMARRKKHNQQQQYQ